MRYFIGLVGGVLLSKNYYDNLMAQRDCAVTTLVAIEKKKLKSGLSGIVFSKDRALQLYSLLSTYRELVINPAPLTVIYNASTAEHENAYEEAKALILEINQNVTFVKECGSFKKTLIKTLDKVKVKNIFFLVDDIIFIRSIDLDYASKLDASAYILSLRHSPLLTRSYTANKKQIPPKLSNFRCFSGMFKFRWFEAGNEWSNPWSVDGQILSTAEVRVITKVSSFSAPNSYETAMTSFNNLCVDRIGLCYSESKILNLPLNRVQNECENLSGTISPEYLLDKWQKGLMLDTSKFLTHIPKSPHEEHPILFKTRSSTKQES